MPRMEPRSALGRLVRRARRLPARVCPACLAACLAAAGCVDFGGPGTSAPIDSGTPKFDSQVQPIFTQNCALAGCHADPTPQDAMSLEPGKAYGNIVGVRSVGFSIYWRVKPFDTDSSLVYLKAALDNPPSGARMPLNRPKLPAQSIETLRAWIAAGAPR